MRAAPAIIGDQTMGGAWLQACQCAPSRLLAYIRHHDKPAEKAGIVPLRAVWSVGDLHRQVLHDVLELSGRGQIDRLVDIIRGGVIALRQPLLMRGCFWRSRLVADTHSNRRNSLPDKA